MQKQSLSHLLYKRAHLIGEMNMLRFLIGKKLTNEDMLSILEEKQSKLEITQFELNELDNNSKKQNEYVTSARYS